MAATAAAGVARFVLRVTVRVPLDVAPAMVTSKLASFPPLKLCPANAALPVSAEGLSAKLKFTGTPAPDSAEGVSREKSNPDTIATRHCGGLDDAEVQWGNHTSGGNGRCTVDAVVKRNRGTSGFQLRCGGCRQPHLRDAYSGSRRRYEASKL